jgi:hypothetical protein
VRKTEKERESVGETEGEERKEKGKTYIDNGALPF